MFAPLKFLLLSLVVSVSFVAHGFSPLNFGGEIPWPLSNQRMITVDKSSGLWELENIFTRKLYNVEMIESEDGFDWIRIANIDPETYEVISWGEGTFINCTLQADGDGCRQQNGASSFSNILLDSQVKDQNDQFGRYIHMYPNGDLTLSPYLVRLVEVKTGLGNVLGVSVVDYVGKSFEHLLGSRLLSTPLSCVVANEKSKNLDCRVSWY